MRSFSELTPMAHKTSAAARKLHERKRMDNSKIHEALMAVQSELKAPKGQMNTFGGYKYRSCEDILEAVKPILKEHGLLLTLSDEPKVLEGWHYIEATAKMEELLK
jgi:hypothetical protein